MAQQDPGIFTGGQMTDLPLYTDDLLGDELMEIVAPGNAALGINYRITLDGLAPFMRGYRNTIITAGATLASPYVPLVTDTRVLLNKTIQSASYITFDLSVEYRGPVLIKDMAGDAGTHIITVTFTGGELCDGLATFTIENAYGWLVFCPLDAAWYQSSF